MSKIARWFARSKDAITSAEVTERLKKVEYALESQHVRLPQAQANLASGEAVSKVLAALQDVPEAAIQIDTLLILKAKSVSGQVGVFVRTLSQKELALLEANPGILSAPSDVLKLFGIRQAMQVDGGAQRLLAVSDPPDSDAE